MKLIILMMFFIFSACTSQQVRFPASVEEINPYSELKKSLILAAENNIVFHLSNETLQEAEKKEIDSKCSLSESPFWSEKLSVYLNLMKQNPHFFSKIHVLEIKKGDLAEAVLQKDMDGASVLSIQYVKTENRGQVTFKTLLPCSQNKIADYLNKDLIQTQFEFPLVTSVSDILNQAEDKKSIDRFNFSNQFLVYLAERGFIFKFNHETSFTKSGQNQFVFVQLMNKYSQDISNLPFKNKSENYLSFWMQIVNKFNQKDQMIQLFSFEDNQKLSSGININSQKNNLAFDNKSKAQLNIFTTYFIQANQLQFTDLFDLNQCLSFLSNDKSQRLIRSPSSEFNIEEQSLNDLICEKRTEKFED